ncbi:MAG: hypothetical protein WCR46_16750 [Deltaproteobacteria bacterium]
MISSLSIYFLPGIPTPASAPERRTCVTTGGHYVKLDILYPLYPNSGNLPDVRGKTLPPTDIRIANCPESGHLSKSWIKLAVMPAANVQEVGGGKACGKRQRHLHPPQAFALWLGINCRIIRFRLL